MDMTDPDVNALLYRSSGYLATVTLESLNEMFSNARGIMDWLSDIAKVASASRQPVSWVTPLGIPIVQPYKRKHEKLVKTVVQVVLLADAESNLPVSTMKQKSAFPPNYIHSLDSTHMLMTALEMKKRSIPFTAVHDSYWCHPCNVDEMNEVLREQFIDLYKRPLLEQLSDDMKIRYPGIKHLELPKIGQLNIEDVRDSTYFFQ